MAYGVRAKATSGVNMEDGHGYGDGEATLGDRLTAAREGAGLEVGELAARLGVRTETLEGWESDQAEPRASLLGRLSGILGVSLIWLMTGDGRGPSTGESGPGAIAAELRDLRRLLNEAARRMDRIEDLLACD